MRRLDLLLLGDLILDAPDPDHWLSGLRTIIRTADLAIGHLEVPHTRRGEERGGDIPAPGADPAHLSALRRAGISALSLAGNHMMDRGAEGAVDTIAELNRLGIAHCGVGATIDEARRPVVLTHADVRIGLLSYNCVGPESSWAEPDKPGCAFIRITPDAGSHVSPTADLVHIDASSLAKALADIRNARAACDVLIVALHKGLVHRPVVLAPYERPLAQAAVDAGADIVVGHHAHIVKGIEIWRGRPIFHGLGNGCVVTQALSPAETHPRRAEWARRRRELFGFEPDPRYELAPFHPEAIHAMLGRVRYQDGRLDIGFVPVHVEPPGRPVAPTPEQALRTTEYIGSITQQAGLPPLELQGAEDMIRVVA